MIYTLSNIDLPLGTCLPSAALASNNAYPLITISDEIGGIKGIIISMIIASVGVFISLNLDSRYKLKEPS